jgi:CIC family chloride channel protein
MPLFQYFHRRRHSLSAPSTPTAIAATKLENIAADEDRLPQRPGQWLMLMILAAIVGALTGLVGAAFRYSLVELDLFRNEMLLWAHHHGIPGFEWLAPVTLCAAGAGVACYLTQRFAPETAGSGIPRVEAVIRNHLYPAAALILPVKFIGGALGIGAGLALGREGPAVQMGGTIGRILADWFKKIVPEPWTLIAAGAGAGLAVAFNAPLAAIIFVVEELLHHFSARVFTATLVACIAATVVARRLLGSALVFGAPRLPDLSSKVLPGYLLLGLLAGFLGVLFNLSILAGLRLSDRAARWPRGAKGALVGAAAGLLGWYVPNLIGGGEPLAQSAISSVIPCSMLVGFLVVRFVLTIFSYSTGAPGGIFAPLLALGALLGSAFSAAQAALFHHPQDPAPYAIVAMAACFTSVIRSPITGVVLLLEMTGSWPLILPMMAASIAAYAIPEILGNPPIYDSLRQRDEEIEKRAKLPGVRSQ